MRCPICGYEFEAGALVCRESCPLGAGCALVCCPRCGYSTIDTEGSRLVRWTRRLLRRSAPPAAPPTPTGAMSLLQLATGQEARVLDIADSRPETLHHLTQFGLMPGVVVRLCQKRPVPIVQIGQTDLALDGEVARQIYVELALA